MEVVQLVALEVVLVVMVVLLVSSCGDSNYFSGMFRSRFRVRDGEGELDGED